MTDLINIDQQDDLKIYSNFVDNEFEHLSLKQGPWGNNSDMIQEQNQWCKAVREAVASIVDDGVISSAQSSLDHRPKLFDKTSERFIFNHNNLKN